MVKRKKLWEHIFFYSCLKWRANYLWLWIQTCDPSRFDYSAFVILFLTSYFVVSKWWPITEWNEFFSLVNLGSNWTGGTKLLLSGFDMTLFTTLYTCDYHITWPDSDRFQNGRRLSVEKKIVENLILHNILSLWIVLKSILGALTISLHNFLTYIWFVT